MTDIVNKATRSRMMSGIRGKHTQPELRLRRALHARGLRFRLHRKNLAGKPDIVFPRARCAIFVHGCFWHRHPGCTLATNPVTRPDFWKAKFEANVARDRRNRNQLISEQWRVAIVWECALKKIDAPPMVACTVADWLNDDKDHLEIGFAPLGTEQMGLS